MTFKKYELGDTELEVLNHVLELEEASVQDVLNEICKYRPLAYTTVMTVMRKLADKGYLRYRKEGKAYIYSAVESQYQVRRGLLRRLLDGAFGSSPLALVQTLVRQETLSPEDIDELDRLVQRLKESGGK